MGLLRDCMGDHLSSPPENLWSHRRHLAQVCHLLSICKAHLAQVRHGSPGREWSTPGFCILLAVCQELFALIWRRVPCCEVPGIASESKVLGHIAYLPVVRRTWVWVPGQQLSMNFDPSHIKLFLPGERSEAWELGVYYYTGKGLHQDAGMSKYENFQ